MKKIKLFDPYVGDEEKASVERVLNSHFWASGAGTNSVNKFEQKFKKYVGSNECVAVNSGTAALNLALSLSDIKNKEVIVSSLTFVSTVNAIKLNQGKPIFCDVNPKTGCISIEDIKKKISKKTIAILPVHFGGLSCDLKNINDMCKSNKLHLIEDAAHAAGATFGGKKIGSHGEFVCFSFHPIKNLAMPTGGLISINHPDHKKFEKKLKSLRWCGISNRKLTSYDVTELGNNYYMNEFSAAIGLVQLKKINRLTKMRQKIAKKYFNEIDIEYKMPFDRRCSYHLYWVCIKNRNKFRKLLKEKNIETGTHYKPIHTFTLYKKNLSLPITEKISNEIVTIPIHPNLKSHEIDKIISTINKSI